MWASNTMSCRPAKRRMGVARLADLLRRRSGGKTGFTLLETTIALGILAVGILGVAASLLSALKYSRKSRSMTQAMYLAEQQMEIFHLMPAADVVAMVGTTADGANPIDLADGDATEFDRSWTVVLDTPETDVITITVDVNWLNETGTQRNVSLQRLKTSF